MKFPPEKQRKSLTPELKQIITALAEKTFREAQCQSSDSATPPLALVNHHD